LFEIGTDLTMSDKQIGNVWVFIEQDGGKIADVSLELVSKARELAAELGVATEGVLLGANVDGLVSTLHEYGCDNVFVAQDPRLALSILKRERYDIIFLDLVMPGHPGGLGLFREIKKAAPPHDDW